MPDNLLTGWFSQQQKPTIVGVYETRFDALNTEYGYSYWDGFRWGEQWGAIRYAYRYADRGPGTQEKEWRGLCKKP